MTDPAHNPRVFRIAVMALILLGTLAIVYHASYYAWWCYDDAYISMRYAENLARHGALEYNLGERVEGYSNLLWTLELALAARLGAPPLPAARLLGIAAVAGLLLAGMAWINALGRRMGADWGARLTGMGFVALAVSCSSPLALHAQSGLETVQYALLLDGAFLAGMAGAAAGSRGWMLAGAAAMGGAILSRPEGFAYYPFFAAALLLQAGWREWGVFLRRRWVVLAAPLLALAALAAWRMAYYGLPLPLTVMAKRAISGQFGLRALADIKMFFTYGAQGWIYLVLGPLVLWLFIPRLGPPAAARRQLGGLLLLIAANFLFVLQVGGDILNSSRFMVPAILPLTLLGAAAAVWFARARPAARELVRELSLVALALVLLAGAKIGWGQSRNLFHGVDFYTRDTCNVRKARFWAVAGRFLRDGQTLSGSSYINGYAGLMVPFIQDHWMPGQSAIIGDIGLAGLLAPEVRIIDSNGLVSAQYAWLHHDGRSATRPRREAELLACLDRVRPEWVMLVCRTKELELFPDLPFARWAGARDYEPVLTYWDWGENGQNGWPMRRIEVRRRRDIPLPDAAAAARNYERLARLFPNSAEVKALCVAHEANAVVEIPHRVLALDAEKAAGNRVKVPGTLGIDPNEARDPNTSGTVHALRLGQSPKDAAPTEKILTGTQFLGRFDGAADEGWTFSGAAMKDQPVKLPGGERRPIQGFVGAGLIDTSRGWLVNTAEKGTALSPPFTPRRGDALGFLIGGDTRMETGVGLEVEGWEVRRWHGAGSCLMRFVLVDLNPYAGRAVRIKVSDQTTGPWGSVQADHFVIYRAE